MRKIKSKRSIGAKCVAIVSCILLLVSCNKSKSKEKTISYITENGTDKYIIQTALYQVYEEDIQKYRYTIGTSKKIFAQGEKYGTEPKIEEIGNGIIRLYMGFGTNAFSVQYFDVWQDYTSDVFAPYSIFADYVDEKSGECLIAYFDTPSIKSNVLQIRNFFSEKEVIFDIERNFNSPTCNRIVFLNENELYLDYDTFDDENSTEYKNIREIIKFR